jgi:hypothetical protein
MVFYKQKSQKSMKDVSCNFHAGMLQNKETSAAVLNNIAQTSNKRQFWAHCLMPLALDGVENHHSEALWHQ